MITALGGTAVFGINGFIIGPTITAMFIAVWHPSIVGPAMAEQVSRHVVDQRPPLG